MAIKQLPVNSNFPKYSFKVELSSVLYNLQFRFNIRSGKWIMNLLDSSGDMIQAGIPIMVQVDLLGRFKDSRIPSGTLFAINPENENEEATRDNFGDVVLLLYNE